MSTPIPEPGRDLDALLPQYATIRDRIMGSDLTALAAAFLAFGEAAARVAEVLPHPNATG